MSLSITDFQNCLQLGPQGFEKTYSGLSPEITNYALQWRYAVKKFCASKELSDNEIKLIKNILRMSASSFGLQPWKFLFINRGSIREKLKVASWNQSQIVDCHQLIVFCVPSVIDEKTVQDYVLDISQTRKVQLESLDGYKKVMVDFLNRMNDETKLTWAKNQVYLALGQVLALCAVHKIDTCPIEGFIKDKYDEILELSQLGLKSCVVLAVGHRASDDTYANLPKVRFAEEKMCIQKN
jgi:nitroreductase/dihydropteridine reductase